MSALETKGCSELDQFISARTNFADFLDAALENACSTFGVELSRLLVSKTYMYPPADCGTAWETKGDNRQLQYDAIAVLNGDIREDVFIDGDAIMAKREFWHSGNHTVGLGIRKCRRKGADAAFAVRSAEGKEASESASYSFDAVLIDPQRIDVTETSAVIVLFGRGIRTPEVRQGADENRRSLGRDEYRPALPAGHAVRPHGRRGEDEPSPVLLRSRDELHRHALAYFDVLAMMKRAPH